MKIVIIEDEYSLADAIAETLKKENFDVTIIADVLENEVGKNKWLGYIQAETESMNKLINELLLLAKIENVDDIKEYKTFDVSKEINKYTSKKHG